MNRMRFLAAALVVGAGLLAASSLVRAKPDAVGDKAVARGKYLVTIMSCNDCHTPGTFWGAPDTSRTLSGSEMGWVGPWGVAYAANLTPDPETGLGKWKPAEIAKVLRTGNRPDGRQLSPAMPWLNYSILTDADALAIASYLKTLPVVKHEVPKPLPSGAEVTGSVLAMPAPSAWDAPRTAGEPDKK